MKKLLFILLFLISTITIAGIPVRPDAPIITTQGKTIAITGFITVIGNFDVVIAELVQNEWNINKTIYFSGSLNPPANPPFNPLSDVAAKGGIVLFNQWIVSRANELLTLIFPTNTPTFIGGSSTTTEPATDIQVPDALMTVIIGGKFMLPVPVIPSKMRADYDAYWTTNIAVGTSILWANGSITKFEKNLALYADPSGILIVLSPLSDLNAIAKAAPGIAAQWKIDYGFNPI